MGIAEQLQKTDLFKEVEIADLEALITRMQNQHYVRGTVLFESGSKGDTMYIIRKGRIRIYMRDLNHDEITLTHYGENEIFGELSPIDQRPRSASAAAADDLEVLALDREHFLAFLNERPQIGLAMMRSLSQRLRNTTTYLEENKSNRVRARKQLDGSSEEISRKAAQPLIANLLDEVNSPDTGEVAPIEIDEPPPTEKIQRAAGMGGIFDRIASLESNKDDHPDKSE